MANRSTREVQAAWRQKIKVVHILNKLQDFIEGAAEMTQPQVTAALGLLKKCLPDVSQVDQTLEQTTTHYVVEVPAQLSAEEWQQKHANKAAH